MAEKKIIAVVGATGAQGGGLVRAILSDASNGFTPRALTRNVNSDKATELAKLGADVVAADLDEIQSLKKAFEGAYGAFCVTNFWEHFSPEKELAQATNMARAAKEAGLRARHLVNARRYAPVGAAERQPHADLDGQVQGAALRRQGRRQSRIHGDGRADDVPADFVLLGQLHPLRDGPEERPRRHPRDHNADG